MKLPLLAVMLAVAMAASAAPIGPDEALGRINPSAMPGMRLAPARMRLVHTGRASGQPEYYVFANASGSGYVIASADSRAEALLGYVAEGTFDVDDMPPAMLWWLEEYGRQIAASRAGAEPDTDKGGVTALRPVRAAIAPMVATLWNQSFPYYNLCPTYNGSRCVTGCVATAMAQLMRYHKHPLQGRGSHSYYWNYSTLLSMDFGSTTFDWENMTHTYPTSSAASNPVQNNAVAVLMKACGISVEMEYDPNGSGAYSADVLPALTTYFDYSRTTNYRLRLYHNTLEWEEMVYNSLAAGSPCYYHGRGDAGGHAFVCDGYGGDGYFHFNWGWGGKSDGYFLLHALNPSALGTGGGSGGFNTNQGAILGMRPSFTGARPNPFLVAATGVRMTISSGKTLNFGKTISYTLDTLHTLLGFEIVAPDGSRRYAEKSSWNDMRYATYISSWSAPLPSGLANGLYVVRPVFATLTSSGEKNWHRIQNDPADQACFFMQVTGGSASLKTADSGFPLTFSDMEATSPVVAGQTFCFRAKVKNTTSYAADARQVRVALTRNDTLVYYLPAVYPVSLGVRDSALVNFSAYLNPNYTGTPGQYGVVMVDQSGVRRSPVMAVNPSAAPDSVAVTLDAISIPGSAAVNSGALKVYARVKCTAGAYNGLITLRLTRNSVTPVTMTRFVSLAENETADVEFSCGIDGAVKGQKYVAVVSRHNLTPAAYQQLVELGRAEFVVGTTEVETLPAAAGGWSLTQEGDVVAILGPEAVGGVEVYSMQGMRQRAPFSADGQGGSIDVSALPAGIYLVRVSSDSGVRTLRLLRR